MWQLCNKIKLTAIQSFSMFCNLVELLIYDFVRITNAKSRYNFNYTPLDIIA